MITSTSFNNVVLAKLYKAIKETKEIGRPVYVYNRKGNAITRVQIIDGQVVMYRGIVDLRQAALKAVRQELKRRGITNV